MYTKHLISIGEEDIDKISVSNRVSLSKKSHKFIIGYKDDDYEFNPLYIIAAFKVDKHYPKLFLEEYK